MLFRVEFNVDTEERTEVPQKAYKKGEDILVLDVGVTPPSGFVEFDPEEEPEV